MVASLATHFRWFRVYYRRIFTGFCFMRTGLWRSNHLPCWFCDAFLWATAAVTLSWSHTLMCCVTLGHTPHLVCCDVFASPSVVSCQFGFVLSGGINLFATLSFCPVAIFNQVIKLLPPTQIIVVIWVFWATWRSRSSEFGLLRTNFNSSLSLKNSLGDYVLAYLFFAQ